MIGIWRHASAALLGVSALSMQGHGIAYQPPSASFSDNPWEISGIELRVASLAPDLAADTDASRINLGDCVAGDAATLQSQYETMCRDISATIATLLAGEERSVEPQARPARLPLASMRRAIVRERAAYRSEPRATFGSRCFIDESGTTWTRSPRAPAFERAPMRHVERTNVAASTLPGVLLPTRADCALRSPVGGKVVFAGPLKGYLGMVIIKLADGRHLVAAGLGNLAVRAGDTVARGDVLGRSAMQPSPALSGDVDAQAGPLIYLEMRSRKGTAEMIGWLR